ncbi:aminotransferase class I/II-fold pyridoxal phosphate-dependent enzyme [Hymenobacter cellulosivorans]|uniref:Aminotransferase class I/II-fold pyridoxal phosphate-dependent enzyme n=1 Tax=Hymenobacter cellulosivorans TaxID=2932249 RepID=A0ABY4F5D5_9BACT|nr:aminotransferase class I/II-fold pyridoxal phosphate-dependent enzyme [Hymenobacter cellulosivorans]UOQ51421.1 aminotransferase class I/II-fold pyridoxal phosphate-dependent enzyme [Hymenobacter cellulosivorans]
MSAARAGCRLVVGPRDGLVVVGPMVDFTSALYLGPPRLQLPAGLPLTTGRPAALQEPDWHRRVAGEVARRQGLETGLLAPSTLHLFWDVLTLLPRSGVVFIDKTMYPVGQWGAARAVLRGLPVVPFSAANLPALARQLHTYRAQGRTPWLLTDGWRLNGAGPAPLARYLQLLSPDSASALLVDDTQAFGVLGARPSVRQPLGQGGGGTLPYLGVRHPQVLTITSLAKGLGVPVAVLAGSRAWLRHYEQCSTVRVHTSPVSGWHAAAAAQVLQHDARHGEAARHQLTRHIGQFRQDLQAAGLRLRGGWFPVQKLVLPRASASLGLYQLLREEGFQALLLADAARPTVPQVAFCLRADHRPADLRRLTGLLAAQARRPDWFSVSHRSTLLLP